MPIKKTPNSINLFEHEDVLSFFTFSKRNHFDSESKLYDALSTRISSINTNYIAHLTTYPFISVHISHGLTGDLGKNKEKILTAINEVLNSHLKQT
jgi:hypothetical protein